MRVFMANQDDRFQLLAAKKLGWKYLHATNKIELPTGFTRSPLHRILGVALRRTSARLARQFQNKPLQH